MEELIRKYRRKGILIDTNLLLSFVVGSLNRKYLVKCRATTKYFGPEDFPLLARLLGQFNQIVTTPHILTEVSNLAGRLGEPLRSEFRQRLRLIADEATECFEPSQVVCRHADFPRVGLTDVAITMTAPEKYLVLTDDAPLADLLGRQNVDVVNFNHIRLGAWQ